MRLNERLEVDLGNVQAPRPHAALLQRLGSLPFWRGEAPLAETLQPLHVLAHDEAMRVLTGARRVEAPNSRVPVSRGKKK